MSRAKSPQMHSWRTTWWYTGLAVPVVVFTFLNLIQPNRQIPGRDSGVFLYMGQQILRGQVPYQNIWDHKPPAIFYFDALGLVIGSGKDWGVWLLEGLALYAAQLMSFRLLRQAFGVVPALFATLSWLVGLVLVIEGGNYTEELALPVQFAALYLFWQAEQTGVYRWRGMGIGVTLACAGLLKQTLIGIPVAIILYIIISRGWQRQWRELFYTLVVLGAGALLILGPVALYFCLTGTLPDLLDDVLRYNLTYSVSSDRDKIKIIFDGLALMNQAGLSLLACTGWLIGLIYLRFGKPPARPLLGVAMIAFPIELVLVSLSGRLYLHYFIAWLACFAVLTAFTAHLLVKAVWPNLRLKPVWLTPGHLLLAVLLVVGSFMTFSDQYLQNLTPDPIIQKYQSTQVEVAHYIEANTAPTDYVLMWGAESSLNFVTGRLSPTRYIYQYPLYTLGYQRPTLFNQFLADIIQHPPVLIVDAWSAPGSESVPPLDPDIRRQWIADRQPNILPPDIAPIFSYISEHYMPIAKIGQSEWQIYRLKSQP